MKNMFKNTWKQVKAMNDHTREFKSPSPDMEYHKATSELHKSIRREDPTDKYWEAVNKELADAVNKQTMEKIKDLRYNTPKEKHKASDADIERTIDETEIYRKAKERILKHQQGQVGYGIDKYPEPLTASTWTIFETLDHAMDESIDRMHYFEMLRIKFQGMVDDLNFLNGWKTGAEEEMNKMELELEALRDFKARVELLGGEPFKVYQEKYEDTHIYTDNMSMKSSEYNLGNAFSWGGADLDGDHIFVTENGPIRVEKGDKLTEWKVSEEHLKSLAQDIAKSMHVEPPIPEPINYSKLATETANEILKKQRDMINRGETF